MITDTDHPVRSIMFFAPDPEACCRWWAEHIGRPTQVHRLDVGFCWFEIGGLEIAFHPADDDRNPVGGSPVVYWNTDDVERRRSELLAAGCLHHRGPLEVAPDRRICPLVDPFGNIFGLDGR